MKSKNFILKGITIVIAVVMIMVGVPIGTVQAANDLIVDDAIQMFSASGTTRTVDEALAWVASLKGTAYDYDNSYGAQCVDLIKGYYAYLGVQPSNGNGCDYVTNTLPSGWERIKGGIPQRGDILVYSGNSGNQYGHVAIYESEYVLWHGRFAGNGVVQRTTSYRYNGLSNPYWGLIRPNFGENGAVGITPEFPLVNDGIYRIKNVNSGKYIDILEQSLGNEVDLHQWAYANTNSQLWRAVQHGDGYSFISVHSGKAMDVYLASASAGADIHQYTYDACTAQRFKLYNRGNGSYSIHPLCSNLALDIYGSSTDNGAKLKQYAYHGGANQLFSFEAVDTTAPTISNVQVTNVTRDGYTVTCNVEDNAGGVGVERVSFPTWSDVNGQDDLSSDWYNVCAVYPSGTGNTYTFNVNVANHGYAEGGYTTHIYAYDRLGNYSSAGVTAYINRQIALQSFTLSATSINLNINQTQQLSVTSYIPSDTTVDKTATWQSSDRTVATVDSQGNVKALKAGTATITCTVAGKTKTCTVKVAKVVAESPAKITKQPTSQKVNEGKTATFTVKTSGSGLTYQWQVSKNNGKKWSNTSMSGNNTSTLKVKASKGRNGYRFRCIVKDKKGNTITSKAVKLTVTSNVKITKQPSSQKVKEGKTATFTVKASGTKLKYQWQVSKDNGKKWSNTSLSGNKTSKLKVKASKGRNGYKFRCIIKDKNGKKVTSKAVKLTVTTSAKTNQYTSNLEVDNTTVTTENTEIIEEIIENSVSSNDISVSSGDSLQEE